MTGGIKKSEFLGFGDNPLPSSGTVDFVYNGTNYKMLLSDFLSNLGVTGEIVQLGNPLSAPVLDDQGTVKAIRNIAGGFGVTAQVNAEDDIEIAVGYSFNEDGTTLVDDVSASEPLWRSLIAGTGITIGSSAGQIQISLSGGVPVSTKTIVITQLSDFPPPVADVITLDAETNYFINNDVALGTNRLVLQHYTRISGAGPNVATLSYTGTGTMFTWVDASVSFSSVRLSCTAGTLMGGSNPTLATGTMLMDDTTVEACATIGSLSDLFGLRITNSNFLAVSTNGIYFSGTCGYFFITGSIAFMDAGTGIDLDSSVWDGINFTNSALISTAPGVVLLSGLTGSGNLSAGNYGAVVNLRIGGFGGTFSGISVDDGQWLFLGNDDAPDTYPSALLSLSSNATPTVFAGAGTPTIILGTWADEQKSQFSFSATGRATYLGTRTKVFPITFSTTAILSSGSADGIKFYVALNGSIIPNSAAQNDIGSATSSRTSGSWMLTFTEGDYIELYAENTTDTTSLIVSDAVLRIG